MGWVVAIAIAIAIVIVVCIVFLDDGLQLADHQVQGHGVESHGHNDVCVALGRLHKLQVHGADGVDVLGDDAFQGTPALHL